MKLFLTVREVVVEKERAEKGNATTKKEAIDTSVQPQIGELATATTTTTAINHRNNRSRLDFLSRSNSKQTTLLWVEATAWIRISDRLYPKKSACVTAMIDPAIEAVTMIRSGAVAAVIATHGSRTHETMNEILETGKCSLNATTTKLNVAATRWAEIGWQIKTVST